jgi:hypothetical protein
MYEQTFPALLVKQFVKIETNTTHEYNSGAFRRIDGVHSVG